MQAYSPLGKGTRQVLEDKTVSSVAQRCGRTNAQVPYLPKVSCPVAMILRSVVSERLLDAVKPTGEDMVCDWERLLATVRFVHLHFQQRGCHSCIMILYNIREDAQVLIRWSLQQGFIPLPKSSNAQRQQSNLDVFSFELEDQDMAV